MNDITNPLKPEINLTSHGSCSNRLSSSFVKCSSFRVHAQCFRAVPFLKSSSPCFTFFYPCHFAHLQSSLLNVQFSLSCLRGKQI